MNFFSRHPRLGIAGACYMMLFAATALPASRPVLSQDTKSNGKNIAFAYRIPAHSIRIDGRLDELVWAKIKGIGNFIQHQPDEGQPATQPTTVQIAYDDEALYIAMRAYDSQPQKIASHLTRRDVFSPSDWLGVAIDSYNDNRTATVFQVNPSEVQVDYKVTDDNFNSADFNWDAIWEASTAIYNNGWVAEFRIPLNQLRFTNHSEMLWGFQAFRIISRRNEGSYWRHRPQDTNSFVSLFGTLRGLRNMEAQSGIQVLPYSIAIVDNKPVQHQNPAIPNPINSYSLGLDAKVPIKNNITLDLTINPDFGQVESDPSIFNLADYEIYFEEKRPFFIENSNMFDYRVGIRTAALNDGILFYSRRIGRTPHLLYQSGPEQGVRQTPATHILGAGKISGKTDRGWSIGMIEAVTAEEQATLYSNGKVSKVMTEPLSNYFVGRLQKDFNDGNTILGGIATNVLREQGSSLASTLPSSATTGGLNFSHRWDNKTYDVKLSLLASTITGDTLAIQRAQRSSARYFQRPDARHLNYNPGRTRMSGFAGKFILRKIGGNWNWALGGVTRSPGFEINDIGFMRRADFNGLFSWLEYNQFKPGPFFRYWSWNAQAWRAFNYDAMPISQGFQAAFIGELLNYWRFYYYATRDLEAYDPYLLRGGAAFLVPGHTRFLFQMDTDMRKIIQFSLRSVYEWDDSGFKSWYLSPTFTVRPAGRFDLAISLLYQDGMDDLQYLYRLAAQNNHLLGRLNRKTFYTTIRANLAITTKLTLQFYGMPYISSGNYNAFHTVADPRAPDYQQRLTPFNASGFDPDFNYKEYQSNFVLRWEYRRGSTLYFVWSQRITQLDNMDNFDLIRDVDKLYSVQPHNVFLIKLNKWLDF